MRVDGAASGVETKWFLKVRMALSAALAPCSCFRRDALEANVVLGECILQILGAFIIKDMQVRGMTKVD